MINILTIDIEDYLSLFSRDFLGREAPISNRVVDCTLRILDILARSGASATCFCLGSVARKHPKFIREIRNRGFEVASHGMDHIFYHKCDELQIKNDLSNSRSILEDILGEEVLGFRAPHFNVSLNHPAVIQLIVEAGYKFDSSIFPFQGRRYGSQESLRGPYRIRTSSGTLIEFPLATVVVAGRRIPAAGGGYLRHFPYQYSRWAIRSLNSEGIQATVYLHPYECDTEPFEYPLSGLKLSGKIRATITNIAQYHGRSKTLKKLEALTRDFKFSSIANALNNQQMKEFSEISLNL